MLTKLPNILTLSRIGAIPLLIVTFYLREPVGNWLGLAILAFAGITDFFDGYFARAWQQQSFFGKFLDPIADKLLVSALLLMLVAFDRVPGIAVLPAVVILCRELLVSGLREFLAEIRVGVPVSRLAQWKTTLQMLMLGFLLVGPAGPDFGPLSTTDIGVIGLWIAAILTLITGYDYLRAGIRHVEKLDNPDPAAETYGGEAQTGEGEAPIDNDRARQ
ncbi:MAG: CDP-diacylglycerol--glycerol-3-phosphate 3-phosphatidyltransferase [Rhodospirillales bacterium]|jgi:cardiolipin synthase|nr:CDP-diacylglycerol--glycerol-3-phosphate 3-phosphatidyltransferase [Rhodospirillaceae bacterium]MDP6429313.1 CDP-diacylglycerol--glycerol-3-phosphate 3-phosphatidyltransferase [Rhodospirillales bacterium]MDP6643123.1 CDP-diacylglycerol--glycerol-3-phosphate 3-phosphatidyltransferase [Rhodospirillales bacterium]MDP6842185.1 CDP-diacylglycerol--glycerol-3-phosphate 3-phosphatidyltransferase [Rhodospirillales bacterium]|tara:strand:- start:571 stop:1224 length:654 start_codon:yes stop_codon:yes gene_type:complete